MKRALLDAAVAPSTSPLKRRPFSLSSIRAALEDDDENPSSPTVACTRDAPDAESDPTISTTEASSDQEGLFVEEDDDENDVIESSPKNANVAVEPAAVFLPLAVEVPVKAVIKNLVGLSGSIPKMSNAWLRTGIVHEAASGHLDRFNRYNRERPTRVSSIIDALKHDEEHLLEKCHVLDACFDSLACNFLEDEDYLRVHLPGYMQRLNTLETCSCTRLDHEASQFKSIFLTDQSTNVAKRSASLLCSLVSKVVAGQLDNGFAVIRPPGHHAEPGLAGGYCLINNVAVAASYARSKLGVDRVLIVDWDIHHGNGTQAMFLDDPSVMYFSVHRWHSGNFYPFQQNAGPATVGVGCGKGYNVNVGWTRKGMGDEEYFAVWECLLMPMVREFQPGLILVSSGFDGAAGDMGECDVSPECFGALTGALMSVGPVVCALEGGYVRSVLQACVKNVVGALLDPQSPGSYDRIEQRAFQGRRRLNILDTIDSSAAICIRATIRSQAPYWKCLRGKSRT